MAYRDVTSLLARIDALEAEKGRVRARARRIVLHRRARRRVWLGRFAVVLFFVMLLPALFLVGIRTRCGCCGGSQKGQAKNDTIAIQPVAEKWRVDHDGVCPTVEGLKRDRELSPGSKLTDPWDHLYEIRCEADDVHVVSAGPDGMFGTTDDISGP